MGDGRVPDGTGLSRDQYEAAAWVVYDACDEFYLGAEKWVEDLWEALTFSRDGAERAAEEAGGVELNIRAEPYAWHDQPSTRPRDSGSDPKGEAGTAECGASQSGTRDSAGIAQPASETDHA